MSETTRCKVICSGVTKELAMYQPQQEKFLYRANFVFVSSGSKENEEFFKWTPSGSLNLAVYKDDRFEPGKSYYLDITPAVE